MKKILNFVILIILVLQMGFVSSTSVVAQGVEVTWPRYHELILDEARGVIYASDPVGHKIDVLTISPFQFQKSFTIPGSEPRGIALSPDGSELAIADHNVNDLGYIIFLDPATGTIKKKVRPDVKGAFLNKPWDVVYGRPGRLYSSGYAKNNSGDLSSDYIHVFDTTTYSEIGTSDEVIRFKPTLVISSDLSYLFTISAETIPEAMYKFDITTDAPTLHSRTPHSSPLEVLEFVLTPDDQKIFTSSGQVWSSDLIGLIGNTGQGGHLCLLPTHNAVAFTIDRDGNDAIGFYSTNDFYGIKKRSLVELPGGIPGPMIASSDGRKLYVTNTSGVTVIPLPAGLPGAVIPRPKGSLPYFDMELDETRNVVYGSNPTGHTIDVISMSTLKVIKSFRLANGSYPSGIDLSQDGSELAIAQNGASSILFINPVSGNEISNLRTYVEGGLGGMSTPFDLVYGRPGRLYMVGNPGAYGHDHIHVIDTVSHTEVGHSIQYVRMGPTLAISPDNTVLYVNEATSSPRWLHKFRVVNDNIGFAFRDTNGNWDYDAKYFLVPSDESKIFTSEGQIWNDLLRTMIGTFSPGGRLAEIPSRRAFVSAYQNKVTIFDEDTFRVKKTITLLGVNESGPVASKSDGKILFVSTNLGLKKISINYPLKFQSIGVNDGWVLESAESSNVGGIIKATGNLFVGDNVDNKQYRSILHFDTSALPDNAIITGVSLSIKMEKTVGNDPFSSHGDLIADIVNGVFGAPNLETSDFQATASRQNVGKFSESAPAGWYRLTLGSSSFQHINLTGFTQFRLLFAVDDNNNGVADFVSFYSSDISVDTTNRPTLIIEYHLP